MTLLLVAVAGGYLEEPNCITAVDGAKLWRAPVQPPRVWGDVCDYSIMEAITPNVLLIVILILNQGEFKLLLTGKCL